jgi:hypothetical protein
MSTRSDVAFTVENANRTLPLVKSIVGDVADKWSELVKVREEYGNSSPEHDRIMRELAEFAQEIKALGCHLRDFEQGLIEFPATVDGEDVLLSWKLGEENVSYMYADGEDPSQRVPIPGMITEAEDDED